MGIKMDIFAEYSTEKQGTVNQSDCVLQFFFLHRTKDASPASTRPQNKPLIVVFHPTVYSKKLNC